MIIKIVSVLVGIYIIYKTQSIIKVTDKKEVNITTYYLVFNILLFLTFSVYLKEHSFFTTIIYSSTFILMYISATIDRKFFEIPNKYPISILVLGITNILIGPGHIGNSVKGFLLFAVFFILVILLETLFSSELLGGGDLKLFLSLGFLLGFWGAYLLLLLSHLLRVVVFTYKKVSISIFKTRKKDSVKKDVAFAPYIYIGFVLVVVIEKLIFYRFNFI